MAGNPAYIFGQSVDKSTVRGVTVFVIGSVTELRARDLSIENALFIKELGSFFQRDAADTISPDDGELIIRDAAGNVWKRMAPTIGALAVHAAGTYAERDDYNDEHSPREDGSLFIYLSTDGDGGITTTDPLLFAKLSDGNEWSSGVPTRGEKGGDRYEIKNWDNDRPASGEEIAADLITTTVVFPAGLTGSRASAVTPALADAVYSIQKNGVEIGTITFPAASYSGTFAMASEQTFNAGDKIAVEAPNPRDEELSGVVFSIVGTR